MWPETVFSEDFDEALIQAEADQAIWGVTCLSSGTETTIMWVLATPAADFLREACKDRVKLDKVYDRIMDAIDGKIGVDLGHPVIIAYLDALDKNAPYTAKDAAYRLLKAGAPVGWALGGGTVLATRILKPDAHASACLRHNSDWLEHMCLETTYHSSYKPDELKAAIDENKKNVRGLYLTAMNPVRRHLGMEELS